MPEKFNNASEMINYAKSFVINYVSGLSCSQEMIDSIGTKLSNTRIIEATGKEFDANAGINENSTDIPGAFYNPKTDTVFILKKELYNMMDFHKLIHELIHAASNHKEIGKLGLEQFYYDENNKLESSGSTINEAATELLANNILGGAYAYTEDMNVTIQLIISFLNLDEKSFIEMYFSKECWLDEKNGYAFNSDDPYLLSDLVQEYDRRFPRNNKGTFNKENFIAKMYENAIHNYNNIIDYETMINCCNKLVEFWYIDCGIKIPERIVEFQNQLDSVIKQNKRL